jgi:hypothetical protein
MLKGKFRVLVTVVFAVMGLSAVLAASASATPRWLINGTALTAAETISAKALGSGFTLKSSLPGGSAVNISCPTINATGAQIEPANKNKATRITFGPTCVANAPKCKVQKEITTATVNSESTDLGGVEPLYIKFVPSTQPFSIVKLTECAGEGNFNVQGLASCKVIAPTTAAVEKLCLFKESTTLLGSLRFGTEPATLEGEAGFTLSGTNVGKPWSSNL